MCSGRAAGLHALLATRPSVLDTDVAQNLHFHLSPAQSRAADIGTDLDEHAAAAALAFGVGQIMADLDPRQVGGEHRTSGLVSISTAKCFRLSSLGRAPLTREVGAAFA
jgi:hypothetical protein